MNALLLGYACVSERATLRTQFFPSILRWELKLGSQLSSKHLYPLLHLNSLKGFVVTFILSNSFYNPQFFCLEQ